MIFSFWFLVKKCCWGKSVSLKCFQETLTSKLHKPKFCVHFVSIQNWSSRHLLLANFFGKWILAIFNAGSFFKNDLWQHVMSATFCINLARKILQLSQLFLPATISTYNVLDKALDYLKTASQKIVRQTGECLGNKIAENIVKPNHVINENPRNIVAGQLK